jgi:hypothetical protein
MLAQVSEQIQPRSLIGTQLGCRPANVTVRQARCVRSDRLGVLHLRFKKANTTCGQVKLGKERRGDTHWVYRGTDVVHDAWIQSKVLRAGSATDGCIAFKNANA